jgi:hypothetical protein
MQRLIYVAAVAAAVSWSVLCLFDTAYSAVTGGSVLDPLLVAGGMDWWPVLAAELAAATGEEVPQGMVLWGLPTLALVLVTLVFKPKPRANEVIGLRPVRPIVPTARERRAPAPTRAQPAAPPASAAARVQPAPPPASAAARVQPAPPPASTAPRVQPVSPSGITRPQPIAAAPAPSLAAVLTVPLPTRLGRTEPSLVLDAHDAVAQDRLEPYFGSLDDLPDEPHGRLHDPVFR